MHILKNLGPPNFGGRGHRGVVSHESDRDPAPSFACTTCTFWAIPRLNYARLYFGLANPGLECKNILRGDGAPGGGGTDPPSFWGPMTSNFADICEKRSKMALFDKKCAGGGVPPAPTPKITIPSDFSYPHCLFTMTLLRISGDV